MRNLLGLSKWVMILVLASFSYSAYADGNEEGIFTRWFESKKAGVSKVKFQQYNDLCGSCHFPYQPGLLPAFSWEKIMATLDNHFGQPVTMTGVETRTMTRYLLDNSAGHVNDEISNKMLQSLKYHSIPVRITQTPYFVLMHKQPENYPFDNKMYNQTISQCDSCHQDAQQGRYDKNRLIIPGDSQWNSNHADTKMTKVKQRYSHD